MDPLIRILIEDILVFEHCSEDQMDDDFAIEQLERIVAGVLSAGEEGVSRFFAEVRAMADEARANGQLQRAEQLEAIPEQMLEQME
ncbi:MAG TPA: hypothetical protein VGE67_17985 [Haloferula sp.]